MWVQILFILLLILIIFLPTIWYYSVYYIENAQYIIEHSVKSVASHSLVPVQSCKTAPLPSSNIQRYNFFDGMFQSFPLSNYGLVEGLNNMVMTTTIRPNKGKSYILHLDAPTKLNDYLRFSPSTNDTVDTLQMAYSQIVKNKEGFENDSGASEVLNEDGKMVIREGAYSIFFILSAYSSDYSVKLTSTVNTISVTLPGSEGYKIMNGTTYMKRYYYSFNDPGNDFTNRGTELTETHRQNGFTLTGLTANTNYTLYISEAILENDYQQPQVVSDYKSKSISTRPIPIKPKSTVVPNFSININDIGLNSVIITDTNFNLNYVYSRSISPNVGSINITSGKYTITDLNHSTTYTLSASSSNNDTLTSDLGTIKFTTIIRFNYNITSFGEILGVSQDDIVKLKTSLGINTNTEILDFNFSNYTVKLLLKDEVTICIIKRIIKLIDNTYLIYLSTVNKPTPTPSATPSFTVTPSATPTPTPTVTAQPALLTNYNAADVIKNHYFISDLSPPSIVDTVLFNFKLGITKVIFNDNVSVGIIDSIYDQGNGYYDIFFSNIFIPTPSMTPSMTPTLTQSMTPSLTQSMTPTLTQTITPSFTRTITPSLTRTITPSLTRTITPSLTRTITPSLTRTITPSLTRTITPSLTRTVTPSLTHSITPSFTQSITPCATPSNTLSITPSKSNTPTPTTSLSKAVTCLQKQTTSNDSSILYLYDCFGYRVLNTYFENGKTLVLQLDTDDTTVLSPGYYKLTI